jgi:hypothetical protein
MENKLKGGKADTLTPKKIAKKFDIDVKDVKKQIEYGTCVECEHTDDKEKAKEIATDHVSEFPDYYNRLDKMEKQAEKHWGKKEKTTESKSLVKKLLRENLENKNIEQQKQAELQRLGLDPNTQVYISGEPISCDNPMNEGLKNTLVQGVLMCALTLGVLSCNKESDVVMMKYVYDTEGSLEYSATNAQNTRATCLVPYDHVLSPDEIRAEQDRLATKYEVENNIHVLNDTLVDVDNNSTKSPDIDYSK